MTLVIAISNSRLRRLVLPIIGGVLTLALMSLPDRLAFGQSSAASVPVSGRDMSAMVHGAKSVGIPVPELEDLLTRGRAAGLSDAQLGRFVDILTGLAQDGLPLKPMLDRMRQGLVKKAPPNRIDFAVDKLDRRLRESGRLVDATFPGIGPVSHSPSGKPAPPAIEARRRLIDHAAFALDQGVPGPVLGSAMGELSHGSTPADRLTAAHAPVLALTSLTAGGLSPEQGLAFVRDFHAAGARGPALEDLGFGVAEAIKHGADPMEIRNEIRRALDRGVPPGQILRAIRDRQGGKHPGGPPPGLDRPGARRDRGGPPPPDDPGRRGRRGGRGQGSGRGGN